MSIITTKLVCTASHLVVQLDDLGVGVQQVVSARVHAPILFKLI
jgi:hypothetical protein